METKETITQEELNQRIRKLADLFLKLHQIKPFNGNKERYKWDAIYKSDLTKPLELIKNKANLFYKYSYDTLVELTESCPNELSELINKLLDESVPLESRLVRYKQDMNALKIEGKTSPSDERTAAVFLTCLNPQKYTFYMRDTLYLPLCKWLGIDSEKDRAMAYLHYLSLLQPLAELIRDDKQLSSIFSELSKGYEISDLLNAQTLLWCVHTELIKIAENKEELIKFRHLLEYFVAHLNFVQNGKTDSVGYDEYIKPLVDKNIFKYGGQGQNGMNIQKQVSKWDTYKNGRMCINIDSRNYASRGTYINWHYTGINIMADWDNNAIVRLMLTNFSDDEGYSKWSKPDCKYTIEELGLYEEGDDITLNLIDLFNEFNKRKIELDMERQNNADKEKYQQYINLLKANKNLILTGAPGTGKTYMAKQIAAQIMFEKNYESLTSAEQSQIGFVQFHPSYDYTDFVEGIRPTKESNGFEYKRGVFMEFCAKRLEMYDTTNFDKAFDNMILDMEIDKVVKLKTSFGSEFGISLNSHGNLRLHTGNELKAQGVLTRENIKKQFSGTQTYKWWKGYFEGVVEYLKSKYNLSQVQNDNKRNFVFIIDEINRGEISKIFGDLFYSIDPGYRGIKGRVRTQYANMQTEANEFDLALESTEYGHFFIPENVYIIGTMNDIDRSVESMDFAMRRRFAWKEVTAKESQKMFETHNDFKQLDDSVKTEIVNRMDNLNAAIIGEYKYDGKEIKKIGTLNKDYQIGAAYFLKYLSYKDEGMPFDVLWENHLKILLYDYVRADQNPDEELKLLKKAYDDNKPANNSNKQNNEPNDSDK